MFLALWLQGAAVVVSLLVSWFLFGQNTMLAVSYGGLVSQLSSGLLVWRWHKGLHRYHCDGGKHLKSFHRSSLERFFVVSVVLAAGFVGLSLPPEALLVGFIVGQVAWVAAIALTK
jgi:ATP synthase protein I